MQPGTRGLEKAAGSRNSSQRRPSMQPKGSAHATDNILHVVIADVTRLKQLLSQSQLRTIELHLQQTRARVFETRATKRHHQGHTPTHAKRLGQGAGKAQRGAGEVFPFTPAAIDHQRGGRTIRHGTGAAIIEINLKTWLGGVGCVVVDGDPIRGLQGLSQKREHDSVAKSAEPLVPPPAPPSLRSTIGM